MTRSKKNKNDFSCYIIFDGNSNFAWNWKIVDFSDDLARDNSSDTLVGWDTRYV